MGITSDVAGNTSATSNINTVMASRLVMTSVILSPESGGKMNDRRVKPVDNKKKGVLPHVGINDLVV